MPTTEYPNPNTLSRRRAITLLLSAGGASLFAACSQPRTETAKPKAVVTQPAIPTSATEQFFAPEIVNYAREASRWTTLVNRRSVSIPQMFPEAQQSLDMVLGRSDPRQVLPFVKYPIRWDPANPEAHFTLRLEEDAADPRKIVVTFPGQIEKTFDWPSYTSDAAIGLPPDVQSSSVRSVIITKELRQMAAHPAYAALYLELVRDRGITYRIDHPATLTLNQTEIDIAITHTLRRYEEILSQQPSILRNIVDDGSFLDTGGILFANWYVQQLNAKQPIPQNTSWYRGGEQSAGFLQFKNLIVQDGPVFKWVNGKAPRISSARGELLDLTKEYGRVSGTAFPVLPTS